MKFSLEPTLRNNFGIDRDLSAIGKAEARDAIEHLEVQTERYIHTNFSRCCQCLLDP